MTREATESSSDIALVQAAVAGDREAFEKLYKQHFKRVYSICLRMLGNTAQAEDITQEVFLLVYRKLGTFRGESAFTTWLHRLAVNQVLMYLRKRGLKIEQAADNETLASLESNQRVSVIDRITLEKAISELPPGYRTVFVLHDVEGYEHEEIAGMLGVTVGTSKSQLHKARMRLRRLISSRLETEEDDRRKLQD